MPTDSHFAKWSIQRHLAVIVPLLSSASLVLGVMSLVVINTLFVAAQANAAGATAPTVN